MAETSDAGKVDTSKSGALSPASIGRRQLLRGAAGAAPVMLSLVSRPVIATGVCTTSSAHTSLNTSRPGGQLMCSGLTPSTWAQTSRWPRGYGKQKYFNAIFTAKGYNGKTLLDVVQMTGGIDQDALAPYIVAAMLNAAKALTPATVLDVVKVNKIWTDFRGNGFAPTPGTVWNANQIIEWLKTTMA